MNILDNGLSTTARVEKWNPEVGELSKLNISWVGMTECDTALRYLVNSLIFLGEPRIRFSYSHENVC